MKIKEEILLKLNKELKRSEVNFKLDDRTLDTLILDVSRVVDNKLTEAINQTKNDFDIKINTVQRESMRRYFLGYPTEVPFEVDAYKPIIDKEDYEQAYQLIKEGFDRNTQLMLDSLVARIKKNYLNLNDNRLDRYLEYIEELQSNNQQLIILDVNADDSITANNVAEIIENQYDNLSNYHHMIISFRDGESNITNWKDIADVALFMEQFRKEHNFNVYEKRNKDKRINELTEFVKQNNNITLTEEIISEIKKFYDGVSYGFQFKDLFISDDGSIKTLIMQKVELDEEPKKCPSCLNTKVRGNSYPRVLYKSFECTNPECPSRSKIGRGKRFDLFSSKRQIMLERNSKQDRINKRIYNAYRRDIIMKSDYSLNALVLLYSWSGDSVTMINTNVSQSSYKGRNIKRVSYTKFDNKERIKKLDIYKLFSQIASNIKIGTNFKIQKSKDLSNSLIINGDSTNITPYISKYLNDEELSAAVTSPPYFNAREYSQWDNLLCYLIDMMLNAKAVLSSLNSTGTYIYNIGDVVGKDNIFIHSNMSKRRQMLGFYSIFIFEMIGFKCTGNIIWDKGEVQSKRNSTSNHFPGYINTVNVYEHCLVFSKNVNAVIEPSRVEEIGAVIKVNSKGKNTLGHTAPFPLEIPKLIIPYLKDKNDIIIDPFLGSGTSVIALDEEGYRCVGIELNEGYFDLSCQRIKDELNNLFSIAELN